MLSFSHFSCFLPLCTTIYNLQSTIYNLLTTDYWLAIAIIGGSKIECVVNNKILREPFKKSVKNSTLGGVRSRPCLKCILNHVKPFFFNFFGWLHPRKIQKKFKKHFPHFRPSGGGHTLVWNFPHFFFNKFPYWLGQSPSSRTQGNIKAAITSTMNHKRYKYNFRQHQMSSRPAAWWRASRIST